MRVCSGGVPIVRNQLGKRVRGNQLNPARALGKRHVGSGGWNQQPTVSTTTVTNNFSTNTTNKSVNNDRKQP